jgi:general secretion pathway protein J
MITRAGFRKVSGVSGRLSGIRWRQHGFTLIEVMLAIALVSMIMALAYGGFRASVRATASGEALIEDTNRLRVTHQFVRRQLSLAQWLIIEYDEGENRQIRFEGDSDRVRFIAPMPGYLSYGGPYVQQLSLERGSDGMELVYHYAMLNGYEPGEIEQSLGIVLMDGVRSGSFMFLGTDPEDGSPFWADYWEEVDQMPLAVGLALDLNRENGLVWPEMIAPVMMDSAAIRGSGAQIRRSSDLAAQRGAGRQPRERR